MGFNRKLFSLCVLLGLVTFEAGATSIVQQDFEQIAKGSSLVFEGQVSGIDSRQEGPRLVVTYVHLDVIEVLRGSYDKERITLKYLGGKARGKELSVDGLELPKYGEHGVYFVRRGKDGQTGVHPLNGWGQGHYLVKTGAAGKAMYSSRGRAIVAMGKSANTKLALSKGEVAGLTPATGAARPMSLQAFKQRVKDID